MSKKTKSAKVTEPGVLKRTPKAPIPVAPTPPSASAAPIVLPGNEVPNSVRVEDKESTVDKNLSTDVSSAPEDKNVYDTRWQQKLKARAQ